MIGLHVLTLFALVGCTLMVTSRDLVLVQTIFRHGDRAPSLPYPTDPYGSGEYWPRGWSQLTNEGMRQMHALGRFYRHRYVHRMKLLAPSYRIDEIYVRSSDKERALTSAQAMLSGLYPPDVHELWHEHIHWQPVPVHSSMPYTNDLLLKPTSVHCDAYNRVLHEENGELMRTYNQRYANLFEFIGRNTGWYPMNMSKISDLYSAVYRERTHNLTLPAWLDEIWQQEDNINNTKTVYDLILELKRVVRINEFNSLRKARFRGGYLLGDLVQRMQRKAAGQLVPDYKMIIYSSHDGTVTSLMYALGIGNDQLTPYASAVTFELYRTQHGRYEVDVLFRNATEPPTDRGFAMRVPGCGGGVSCPLNLFAAQLESAMFRSRDEFDQSCQL